jgi:predicted dehydrogenase
VKTVRIGIIGCGAMSRWHGKSWTTEVPQARIVALCDPDKANLDRYRREILDPLNQKPATFADYRKMLRKAEMDGVMIVTPHDQHFEQATAALDAGCHVLVEKPMVVSVEHARKLLKHAKSRERVLSVGLQGSFSPEFAYIRGLIERGELGEVVAVDAFVTQGWMAGTRGTWRQDPKQAGGGMAYDTGAHLFHAMLYLPRLQPVEVVARMDNRGAPVDIVTAAIIRYENGALGSASVCGDATRFDEGISICGTRGEVRTSIYGQRLSQWDARGQLVKYPRVEPAPSMYQNFVDCILDRAETSCPAVWGLRQALLMDALYASARTGRPVKVEPD